MIDSANSGAGSPRIGPGQVPARCHCKLLSAAPTFRLGPRHHTTRNEAARVLSLAWLAPSPGLLKSSNGSLLGLHILLPLGAWAAGPWPRGMGAIIKTWVSPAYYKADSVALDSAAETCCTARPHLGDERGSIEHSSRQPPRKPITRRNRRTDWPGLDRPAHCGFAGASPDAYSGLVFLFFSSTCSHPLARTDRSTIVFHLVRTTSREPP